MNENDEPRQAATNPRVPSPEPIPSDSNPGPREEVPFHVPRD
jgi:hypothetical protein